MSQHEDNRWHRFRSEMPVANDWVYFDHSAVAPLPRVTHDAILGWLKQATASGDAKWLSWLEAVNACRTSAAKMLNAKIDEIALVPSTTAGINIVAEGFPWQSGDNIVTLENEFPSNLYPWLNLADRGVETRLVPVDGGCPDLDRIAQACDERTRVVSMSWVGYASGWRIEPSEVASIAHRHSAYFLLDAIQGLGVFPLDVKLSDIDFLSADGHKWMLGPEGAGLFYVKGELLDRLRPVGVGWKSVKNCFDFATTDLTLRNDAARFEGGTQNMSGFIGLGASLDLLLSFGISHDEPAVGNRVIEITDYACERLGELGAEILCPRQESHKSGVVTFSMQSATPEEIKARCFANQIVLSCRGGGVRISPHAYNNHDDIDRLVGVIKEL